MAMTAADLALARQFLADEGSSAVQTILLSATSGTWTISFNGQTTAALALGAGANEVENALAALSNVGVGNVTVNNTAPYVIYFEGALANVAQPMVTVNTNLLVGATVTITKVSAGGVKAFSDADLNAVYDNLSNSSLELTIALAFDMLVADAAKFNRYTVGQSVEFKEQIFDHLKERAEWWHQWARSGQQVQFVKLQNIPPRLQAEPYTTGVPALGLRYKTYNRNDPWRKGGW